MIFLLAVAASASLGAISANSTVLPFAENETSTRSVKVYQVSSDVTAPELLPVDYSSILRSSCRGKESGTVRLSMVVDETGTPRNVFFVKALARNLDQLALQVASADRFIPGKREGVPVAVAMFLDLKLEGCVVAETTDSDKTTLREHLKSVPIQTLSPNENIPAKLFLQETEPQSGKDSLYRVGNGVSAPVPIVTPEAPFPSDHNQWKTGVCFIALIVDANGMPQSLKITRSLNPAMDRQALEAVSRYRFKPAIKSGQPVPVMMTIEVNFRH